MMKSYIRKCAVCGRYTLKKVHCGQPTVTPHPSKYSPLDPYARFRRKKLLQELGEIV